MDPLHFEVAVIGSGPGGALTAALLAEAGLNVALIERGSYFPLSSCAPFSMDEMVQKYHLGGITLASGRVPVSYVEGSCVGGGSEINSGLYHRTPEYLVNCWAEDFKIDNLSYERLIPLFEKNEADLCVGYAPATQIPSASFKLHEGAQSLGWQSLEVPRWFRYGENGGIKQSMTETFIPRALAAGVRLISNTEINKIRQNDKDRTAWSLDGFFRHGHQPKKVEIVSKKVFVCAGAISTPSLLQRSGLSSKAGRQLHLHPSVKIVAKFSHDINSIGMGVPVHQVKEFSPRYSFGCSISSPPYLSMAMMDIPNGNQLVEQSWRNMAIYYSMTTGGKGSILNIPLFHDPLVRYSFADNDVKDIFEGLENLARVLFAAGAVEIYPVVQNSTPIKSMDEMKHFLQSLEPNRLNMMTIHLFSSCPMGEDKKRCVVNSYGALHNNNGIFLNDASIIPTALGVNPQGTIMALVRRNVEFFLKNLKC